MMRDEAYLNVVRSQRNATLDTIRTFFASIADAKGSAKEAVIKQSNLDERTALLYQFNPLITFGLSDAKFQSIFKCKIKELSQTQDIQSDVSDLSFRGLCEKLRKAPSADDYLLALVLAFLQTCDGYSDEPDELTGNAALVRDFLCKKCKIGVTATTINKALGENLIPTFGCMLANKYFEHQDVVEGQVFYVTEKLDGIRCLCICDGNKVKFYTRQGQLIEGLGEIEQDINLLRVPITEEWPHVRGFVFDGELLPISMDGKTSAEGYKEASRIVRSKGAKHGLSYHVFDGLPLKDFLGDSNRNQLYVERRAVLNAIFSVYNSVPHVQLVPVLYHGKNTSKIIELLNEMRAKDREGVMVNLADALYVCKRTNNLLKVKAMQDCDLRITGAEEGDGKHKGRLGALVVDYKGSELRVGCGFTDKQREDFWVARDSLTGRVISVQYFEETSDANGIPSLRFPVFKELREEGKEVSYE